MRDQIQPDAIRLDDGRNCARMRAELAFLAAEQSHETTSTTKTAATTTTATKTTPLHRPNRRAVKVPIAIFMLMALVRLCSF